MKFPNIGGIARILGPRVLGSLFAGVATYVGVKTSGAVQIDPATAGEWVTGILLSYAAAHKATSSVVNPGDAAETRVAVAEKRTADTGGTVVVPSPEVK